MQRKARRRLPLIFGKRFLTLYVDIAIHRGLLSTDMRAGLLAREAPFSTPSRLPSGILWEMTRLQLRDSTGLSPVSLFTRAIAYRALSVVLMYAMSIYTPLLFRFQL